MLSRVGLYHEVGCSQLVGHYQRVMKAVDAQTLVIEEHSNTPYTKQNADCLHATATALRTIGDELRQWHVFLYPEDAE